VLSSGVFKERGDGDAKVMSTDWSKYSTAKTALGAKNPEANSVVSFVTEDLRYIKLRVLHAPLEDNRAHANVKDLEGAGYLEKRLKLLTCFSWQIKSKKVLAFEQQA
jgi:hypothetical protein